MVEKSGRSWEGNLNDLCNPLSDQRRGGSIFKVPEPLIPPTGARVMSLTDGLSKMSKSAPSDQSRINLLDSNDVIVNKINVARLIHFRAWNLIILKDLNVTTFFQYISLLPARQNRPPVALLLDPDFLPTIPSPLIEEHSSLSCIYHPRNILTNCNCKDGFPVHHIVMGFSCFCLFNGLICS